MPPLIITVWILQLRESVCEGWGGTIGRVTIRVDRSEQTAATTIVFLTIGGKGSRGERASSGRTRGTAKSSTRPPKGISICRKTASNGNAGSTSVSSSGDEKRRDRLLLHDVSCPHIITNLHRVTDSPNQRRTTGCTLCSGGRGVPSPGLDDTSLRKGSISVFTVGYFGRFVVYMRTSTV